MTGGGVSHACKRLCTRWWRRLSRRSGVEVERGPPLGLAGIARASSTDIAVSQARGCLHLYSLTPGRFHSARRAACHTTEYMVRPRRGTLAALFPDTLSRDARFRCRSNG
jgi:hypothetical protein